MSIEIPLYIYIVSQYISSSQYHRYIKKNSEKKISSYIRINCHDYGFHDSLFKDTKRI